MLFLNLDMNEYTLDYFADINECDRSQYICGAGECMNLVGNYSCLCPTGFMFMETVFGRNCMGELLFLTSFRIVEALA